MKKTWLFFALFSLVSCGADGLEQKIKEETQKQIDDTQKQIDDNIQKATDDVFGTSSKDSTNQKEEK